MVSLRGAKRRGNLLELRGFPRQCEHWLGMTTDLDTDWSSFHGCGFGGIRKKLVNENLLQCIFKRFRRVGIDECVS